MPLCCRASDSRRSQCSRSCFPLSTSSPLMSRPGAHLGSTLRETRQRCPRAKTTCLCTQISEDEAHAGSSFGILPSSPPCESLPDPSRVVSSLLFSYQPCRARRRYRIVLAAGAVRGNYPSGMKGFMSALAKHTKWPRLFITSLLNISSCRLFIPL